MDVEVKTLNQEQNLGEENQSEREEDDDQVQVLEEDQDAEIQQQYEEGDEEDAVEEALPIPVAAVQTERKVMVMDAASIKKSLGLIKKDPSLMPRNAANPHAWWEDNMLKDIQFPVPAVLKDTYDEAALMNAVKMVFTMYNVPSVRKRWASFICMFAYLWARDPDTQLRIFSKLQLGIFTFVNRAGAEDIEEFVDKSTLQFYREPPAFDANDDAALVENHMVDYFSTLQLSLQLKKSLFAMICLYLTRAVTKPVDHINRCNVLCTRNFSTLYRVSLPDIPIFFPNLTNVPLLLAFSKNKMVAQFHVAITQIVWNVAVADKVDGTRGVLEASIINAFNLNGMPILGFIQQTLKYLAASLPELWNHVRGSTSMDASLYVALATYVAYVIPDKTTKGNLIAAYSLPPALGDLQGSLWRVARLLKQDVMSGLSVQSSTSTLYLMAKIHDTLRPDHPIISNFNMTAPLHGYESLDLLAEVTISKFNSLNGIPVEERGEGIAEVLRLMQIADKKKASGKPAAAVVVSTGVKTAPIPKAAPPLAQAPAVTPSTNKRDREELESQEEDEDAEEKEEIAVVTNPSKKQQTNSAAITQPITKSTGTATTGVAVQTNNTIQPNQPYSFESF